MSKVLGIFFLIQVSVTFARLDSCKERCTTSYSVHTNDQVEELKACFFGCRLSYIFHLISFSQEPSQSCDNDCSQGYPNSLLAKACSNGCKWTPPSTIQDQSDDLEFVWHKQLFQPIYQIKEYYNSMASRGSTIFVMSSYNDNQQDRSYVMRISVQSQETPYFQYTNQNSNYDIRKEMNYDTFPESNQQEKHGYRKVLGNAYHHGKRWLNCVEKRLGVPYWFLCLILILSLLLTSWVCCSTCNEEWPSEEDIKKYKFSKEMKFHDAQYENEKVPLFFVNEQDPGPLPTKKPLS